MILGRLFAKLFELGTVVVATSNVAPDDLYKGGLNRALFLPFIAHITDHMEVLRLDARTDFRLEKLAGAKMWLVPPDDEAGAALDRAWVKMTGNAPCKPRDIAIKGRNEPRETLRSACPVRGARVGHSANVPSPGPEGWACPPPGRTPRGPARRPTLSPTLARPFSWRQRWTCPPAIEPPEAHAQPSGPGLDIMPICPLPGAKGGHVPRSTNPQLRMPNPRSQGWTCPPGPRNPAERMPNPRSQGWT